MIAIFLMYFYKDFTLWLGVKMSTKKIYMDYNATTPLHPEVKKVISNHLDMFGNPSSLHSFGRETKSQMEESRQTIASFIGAKPGELIFVGSGSEANNTVLSSFICQSTNCSCYTKQTKTQIITTKIEHPCVLETAKCLKDRGAEVLFLDVDNHGKIDLKQLEESISERTGLVSIMMANNEIGTIQDIKSISEIVHKKGAFLHTDAVQAVGKIPLNVNDLNVDFLTLSAHKIYGPKGIGALYVKKGVPFCPLIRGGHQERGRRAGTENTLGILALAKAIEMRSLEMKEESTRLLKLKNILKEGFKKNIPDIKINGHPTDSLYNTLNVSFRGAEGAAILLYMDFDGIAVSTGSACASGSLDPSHVIMSLGTTHEYAHGSMRFSLGRENKEEEIYYIIEKVTKIIEKVRSMSTVY